jgi:hypothetical protein
MSDLALLALAVIAASFAVALLRLAYAFYCVPEADVRGCRDEWEQRKKKSDTFRFIQRRVRGEKP